MQSITTAEPADVASLPIEQRVTIAAGMIAATLNVPQSVALRTLAAVYARASLHTYGLGHHRKALTSHLIESALCARRLAEHLS